MPVILSGASHAARTLDTSSGSLTTWIKAALPRLYTHATSKSTAPASTPKVLQQPNEPEASESDSHTDSTASAHSVIEEVMAGIFTPNARITVNHAPVQRAAFEHDLSQRLNANLVQRNEVEWKDVIEVADSGLVAGMFIVNRYMKFLVRAAPAQRQNVVVFQAKIANKDSTATAETAESVAENGNYLIDELVMTSVDRAVPIHLPQPRQHQN